MIQTILEWPWEVIVFVPTFLVIILWFIRVVSIILGKAQLGIEFQRILFDWYCFYPCALYQTYWWSVNYIL